METQKKLVILGSGRFALEAMDLVHESSDYQVVAFAESQNPEKCKQALSGKPVLWIDELHELAKTHHALCAIGTTRRFSFTQRVEKMGFYFPVIRHPSSWVVSSTHIGIGTIISLGAMVGSNSKIGKHVIINRGTLIGHHTRIGDHVTISPGTNIAGDVIIGDATFIGMGAIILNGVKIGNNSVVGAGSVVNRDVADNVMVLGYPASVARENINGL